MQQAVIAGFARTPFQFARRGALKDTRPDELAAIAIKAVVARTGIDPALIEDVLMGCAYPEGSQGNNIARVAAILAGLPVEVAGATMNRFCGSSMYAIHVAAGQIAMGSGDAFVCAGVESMSMVPQGGLSPQQNPRLKESDGSFPDLYISMGETAENVASRYSVSRVDQELFAVQSQLKASSAQKKGALANEIAPVTLSDGTQVDQDGCLRPTTTADALAGLKPAFRPDGTVTAGTSSPLTDGAVATLVTSADFAKRHGLEVLGLIRSTAVAGVEPEFMGIGPVPASRRALARAGLRIDDIDVIEINEAFGSQAVACVRELGIDLQKVNMDGGAIALGHPLGATGARITAKAAQIMKREGKRFALATQCIGGGQGIATVIEAA